MVIDFHTHAFDECIAHHAMNTLSATCGLLPKTDGTTDGLLRHATVNGVDICVVLNIATKPSSQRVVNDFALSLCQERLIGFGSVHPFADDALDELDRIAALGLRGIKLHPDYQDFFVDDPKAIRVYEKASSLGLITVFHSGSDLGLPSPVHCTPERLSRVLCAFDTPVVAAHLGGYQLFDEVEEYLVGTDVYLDTAFLYGSISPMQARRIITGHGSKHILFGSDCPWQGMRDALHVIRSLDLPYPDATNILEKNALRLLHLPV